MIASGSYNPLSSTSAQSDALDAGKWLCVADVEVQFCHEPSMGLPAKHWCKPGTLVSATKKGGWLAESETGFYLPHSDDKGNRLFKHERLLLMEEAELRSLAHDSQRTASRQGSKGSSRQGSKDSASTASGRPSHKLSFSMPSRSNSFLWVDAQGMSHRLPGNSELLKDIDVRPEVWVCMAPVEFCMAPNPFLPAGKECSAGSRVTAIKQDDWLKVVEVESTFDVASLVQLFGRRSLQLPSKVTVKDTGLFLPFMRDGERLFKNEKLFISQATVGVKDSSNTNGCALM